MQFSIHSVTGTVRIAVDWIRAIEELRSNWQRLVYLLDLYLKRLPPYAFQENVLYCRSKPKPPADKSRPWYKDCPVGKNKLGSFISEMYTEVGIPHKTNHSLRATGATTLFQNKVPEKIIQKTTGHRSLEALRKYEHTLTEQHQAVQR